MLKHKAGFDNATGERCTFIGNGAGENSTVSDNTFVGQNSGSAITSGDANTILGRFSGNEGGLNIRR
jgi:trimeric autotransporter adhesin